MVIEKVSGMGWHLQIVLTVSISFLGCERMPIDKSYKQASLSKYVDCNDDRYNDNSLPLTQTFTVLLGSSGLLFRTYIGYH